MPDTTLPTPHEADAKAFRTGLTLLPWSALRPSPRNPRKHFDAEALVMLAESIAENGLQQNLVVRYDPQPGQPDCAIVAGERRYRAIGLLIEDGRHDPDEASIPVKIVDVDDAQHTVLAILENLVRVDVNAMEEAEGFAALCALDPAAWKPSSIAKKIGTSARHVQQRLGLVERLCVEGQRLLRLGVLTISQAYILITAHPDRQRSICQRIDRYPNLQSLRDAITDGLVPVTRAKFDLATFDGGVIALDNGSRYFADKSQFLAAQRAYGQDLAQRLKDGWSWAEFLEDVYFPSARFEAERSNDVGSGALVLMHPDTGVITLHDKLMPRRAQPAKPAQKTNIVRYDSPAQHAPAPPPAKPTAKEHRAGAAAERLRQQLAQRVAGDSRTALSLLLIDALRADQRGVLEGGGSDHGLPTAIFFGPDAPLKALADLVTAIGRGRMALYPEDVAPNCETRAWHRLMNTPMIPLLQAVAMWTADRVAVPDDAPLPTALAELAAAHGINQPDQRLAEPPTQRSRPTRRSATAA